MRWKLCLNSESMHPGPSSPVSLNRRGIFALYSILPKCLWKLPYCMKSLERHMNSIASLLSTSNPSGLIMQAAPICVDDKETCTFRSAEAVSTESCNTTVLSDGRDVVYSTFSLSRTPHTCFLIMRRHPISGPNGRRHL